MLSSKPGENQVGEMRRQCICQYVGSLAPTRDAACDEDVASAVQVLVDRHLRRSTLELCRLQRLQIPATLQPCVVTFQHQYSAHCDLDCPSPDVAGNGLQQLRLWKPVHYERTLAATKMPPRASIAAAAAVTATVRLC